MESDYSSAGKVLKYLWGYLNICQLTLSKDKDFGIYDASETALATPEVIFCPDRLHLDSPICEADFDFLQAPSPALQLPKGPLRFLTQISVFTLKTQHYPCV